MGPVAARRWLLLYLAALVGLGFLHHPGALAATFGAAFMLAGRDRLNLLRRTLFAVLAFNLSVSLGYALVAWWQGRFFAETLLLLNLRVLLMVFLGFWFVARVDLLSAVARWPTASLLATLAVGQIRTFERLLRDFRLAFTSRNIVRPTLRARGRGAAAQAQALLDKSVAAAGDAALGLRSRGAFDD